MITGMIFEGPQAISEINRGISRFLARDGFADISQAIGVGI
jgi:dihydroorotate dehydrogenase